MGSPFQRFCPLIRSLNENDDSIVMDQKLRYLAGDIGDVLQGDEHMLRDALFFFNGVALEDADFAANFALLFTSHHIFGLNQQFGNNEEGNIFRSNILNMLQENYSGTDHLKQRNVEHFYNSVTLLGEFYHRLHKETHPILIMGTSLLELLTKHLQVELDLCARDAARTVDVHFARLVLTQISLNGPLARPNHASEINRLFYEIRRCLIEVPSLISSTKAFFLMTLDLFYSNFGNMGPDLEQFYTSILEQHDVDYAAPKKVPDDDILRETDDGSNTPTSFSLRNLKNDFSGLNLGVRPNGGENSTTRINKEYLNRPLKANERLKYIQHGDNDPKLESEPQHLPQEMYPASNLPQHTVEPILEVTPADNLNVTYESMSSTNDSFTSRDGTNTVSPVANETAQIRSPLAPITTSRPESVSPRKSDSFSPTQERLKLGSFNWFEEVENIANETYVSAVPSCNKSDNLSVKSYGSNPVSPREGSHRSNRSRRNSFSKHRPSNHYRHPHDDDHSSNAGDFKRPVRSDSQSGSGGGGSGSHPQSWRNSDRNLARNESRNGYGKRGDFERDHGNGSGGGQQGSGGRSNAEQPNHANNSFRRNMMRGGSVDSNIKDFHLQKNRYVNRNQDGGGGDNYENFSSYSRKAPHRGTYVNSNKIAQLPPRLLKLQQQQKQQQLQQEQPANNDCDNTKRFNDRHNNRPTANNRSSRQKGFSNSATAGHGGNNNATSRRGNGNGVSQPNNVPAADQ